MCSRTSMTLPGREEGNVLQKGQRTEQTKARTLSHGCVSCQVSLECTLQNARCRDTRRYWVRTGFRGRVSLTNVGLDEVSVWQHFPTPYVLTRAVGPNLI